VDGDHDLHPQRLVLHVDRVRVQLAELGQQHVARKHLGPMLWSLFLNTFWEILSIWLKTKVIMYVLHFFSIAFVHFDMPPICATLIKADMTSILWLGVKVHVGEQVALKFQRFESRKGVFFRT
jgi:hypothetical protein